MVGEEAVADTARQVLFRTLPGIVELFGHYLARQARFFQNVCERGAIQDRLLLTFGLMLISAVATVAMIYLDPLNEVFGIVDWGRIGAWAGIVPVIAVMPAWLTLRRLARSPVLFTFLNLALVTSILLAIVPGLFLALGSTTSAIGRDFYELKLGRAKGTPLHAVYCGRFEDEAEGMAYIRAIEANTERLLPLDREIQLNTQRQRRLQARMAELRVQYESASPDARDKMANSPLVTADMDEGLRLGREGLRLQNRSIALMNEGLVYNERYLQLEERAAMFPLRLGAAYPWAAFVFVLGCFMGSLVWIWTAIVAWKLTVPVQPVGLRRNLTGLLIIAVFLCSMSAFGLIRSGVIEALFQPELTEQQVLDQARTRFKDAEGWCGPLNSHGVW